MYRCTICRKTSDVLPPKRCECGGVWGQTPDEGEVESAQSQPVEVMSSPPSEIPVIVPYTAPEVPVTVPNIPPEVPVEDTAPSSSEPSPTSDSGEVNDS